MVAALDTYDWEEAFKYAKAPIPVLGAVCGPEGFSRDDVAEVLALVEGENDQETWIGLFRLRDGRFAYLEAWCDYTGWG